MALSRLVNAFLCLAKERGRCSFATETLCYPKVGISSTRRDPSTGRPLEKTDLDQVRLVNFLNGVFFFIDSG
jgi:hypothetical protein